MDDINLVAGSIFGILKQIFALYTADFLLTGIFALWVVRRVARLFDRL